MDSINRQPRTWVERDKEAWEKAARNLEAQGYTRRDDSYWPAVFVKDDSEKVLVRDLGMLNWFPRDR